MLVEKRCAVIVDGIVKNIIVADPDTYPGAVEVPDGVVVERGHLYDNSTFTANPAIEAARLDAETVINEAAAAREALLAAKQALSEGKATQEQRDALLLALAGKLEL